MTQLKLCAENVESFERKTDQDKVQNWRINELHGRFFKDVHKYTIAQLNSVKWLKPERLFPETSKQDQVIRNTC